MLIKIDLPAKSITDLVKEKLATKGIDLSKLSHKATICFQCSDCGENDSFEGAQPLEIVIEVDDEELGHNEKEAEGAKLGL